MVEQFDLVKHIIKRHLNGKNIGKQGYDLRRKSQSRKICNISTIYWIPWKWLNSDSNSKLTQIRYYQRNRVFSHVSYRLWLQEDINYQQSYMSIGQVWDSTRWNLADKILTSVTSSHWLLQVTCCCQIVWKFYCCYTTQREVSRAENSLKFCKGFGGEFWSFINLALLEIRKIKFSATNFVFIHFYYIVISQKNFIFQFWTLNTS